MAIGERGEFYEHEKETFSQFLYNKNTGTVMGRTGMSWLKIGVFYLIFYSFLAGFFAVMMTIFYQTLDTETYPTYTPGDGSSILLNPALGFRPLPRRENVESTLIWYKSRDPADYGYWVAELDKFIEDYKSTSADSGQHLVDCSEDRYPGKDEACMFEETYLQECNSNDKWGYDRNQPCVLLKLNKMINWTPDLYNDPEALPADMPQDLKDHISNSTRDKDGKTPEMIWVSCKGENPADQEYVGPISYYPDRGFAAYYFPYRNTPGYLSPVVAVQFLQPEPYVLINIECKVWAKNIVHDRGNRLGLVHFELLMD